MASDNARPEDIQANLAAAASRLRGFSADPSMAINPEVTRREPSLGGYPPEGGEGLAAPAAEETPRAAGPNRLNRLFGRRQAEQPDLLAGVTPRAADRGSDFAGGAEAPARLSSGRRWRNRAILAAIAAGLILGLSFLYFGGGSGDSPVLIAADPNPEKVKPEDPGGLQVPNQNSTLLNNQAGLPAGGETVLPAEEQPAPLVVEAPSLTDIGNTGNNLALPAAPAMPEVPMVAAPPVAAAPAIPEAAPALPAPEIPAVIPAAVSDNTAPAVLQPAIDQPAAAPVAADQPLPVAAVAPGPGGSAFVQLAAVKSEAAARKEWSKLQKKYPDLLGALDLRLQKVDKGAEGVFVRVQAGPFADKSTAKSFCGQLKAVNQPCLVAK